MFPWCKPCKTNYQKNWINALPPEVRRAKDAAWKANRKKEGAVRDRYLSRNASYSLKRRYGLTTHQVVELAKFQCGVCAICGAVPDTTKPRGGLHVDHDHNSGDVRGLLCEACNLGLGFFADAVDRLAKAIEYLKSPPRSRVLFTEEEPRPDLVAGVRNPDKAKLLDLKCKGCGCSFQRKASDEFASRAKGKEGPFCSQKCSGLWGRKQQKVGGLVHGTTNGYTQYKCRCTECRKAHADAERARLERKKVG